MTTDALLNILLTVVVPGLMALIGGALAARALPGGKNNREIWYWIAGFVVLFVISVILSFVQQVRATVHENATSRAAQKAELDSHGEIKYMQGQLDTMSKVLGNLATNSAPSQIVLAMRAAMPSAQDDRPAIEKMSSAKLREAVIDFCGRLRMLSANAQAQEEAAIDKERATTASIVQQAREKGQNPDMRNDPDMQKAWDTMNQREREIYAQFDFEYKQDFAADAVIYRDELLRRLGPQPPPDPNQPNLTLFNDRSTVAPLSVDATALYLETLAKRLP